MKKRNLFTIIFVIIAAAAIAAGFFILSKRENREPEQPSSVYSLKDEQYNSAAKQTGEKFYESSIDGVFYTLSPVKYFKISGGEIKAISASGTFKSAVSVSGAKMKFEIPYIKEGGEIFGVGTWHSDSGVYNDAFAVLKDMPEAFSGGYSALLLIDTDRNDLSANERKYSELFKVNLNGDVGGYVFDQRNRTVEQSGKLRTDWDVLTLDMLKNHSKGAVLSLSAKKYTHSEGAQIYDLMITENGSTSVLESEVLTEYAALSKGKASFIKAAEGGWQAVQKSGKDKKVTAKAQGDIYSDYEIKGDFAYNKENGSFISLKNGKEYKAPSEFKAVYDAEIYGTKLIYIGKEENRDGEEFKVQKIVISDTESEQLKILYANDIMDENSSLFVCSEGIVTLKGGKSVFISFSALETIA